MKKYEFSYTLWWISESYIPSRNDKKEIEAENLQEALTKFNSQSIWCTYPIPANLKITNIVEEKEKDKEIISHFGSLGKNKNWTVSNDNEDTIITVRIFDSFRNKEKIIKELRDLVKDFKDSVKFY